MGIVTWATIRCRPLPKIRKAFLVPSEDVGPLIEMAYRITYKKLGEELLILNNVNLASILGRGKKDIETLRAQLPSWVLIFGIEGAGLLPEEKVGYQEEEFVEVAQTFGLEVKAAIPGARADAVSKAFSQPSAKHYWKLKYQGGCTDIFFITTLDRTPGFIDKVCGLAGRHRYAVENMGVYIQPTVQGTNAHLEFNFSYPPENQVEADKMRQFAEQGSEVLANMGAFFTRPYGSWARIAYGCEAQTVIGQRKLKAIFDPKGIMNPGKLCF
jgi:FAD/FMN-containing dehydrogenase